MTALAGLRPDVAARLVRGRGPRDEVEAATRWLVERHADGHPWRDLALVVPGKRKWRDPIAAVFDAHRVPHRMLVGHPGAVPSYDDDLLHAMSLHTAIATTHPVVAIVGLGDLPWKQQSLDEATSLVEAAVASATAHLFVSWSKASSLTAALLPADAASDASDAGLR